MAYTPLTAAAASCSYSSHHRQYSSAKKYQQARAQMFVRRPAGRMRAQRAAGGVHCTAVAAAGEIAEVAALKGIRVLKNEDDTPRVEYLVAWKDDSPDTWEPAGNLADNLLRDYEQQWWGAVKKGDEAELYKMMEVGGPVLARTVDENRRSALHFAAALGKPQLVSRLCDAGAEVDLADREGYTPLHMAAGYMHTTTIASLLAAGADPEQEDRQGRSPLALVEGLRAALPANNPMVVSRRMALEEVIKVLTDNLFEDVEPAAVLDKREKPEEEGGGTEWLIQFYDEAEPVWVPAKYVSQEVVEDFEGGLEYAEADRILQMKQRGTSRSYLVRWQDGSPDSWEPEENVSMDLVRLFEQELEEQAAQPAAQQQQRQPPAPIPA